jgi:hypothetical protein
MELYHNLITTLAAFDTRPAMGSLIDPTYPMPKTPKLQETKQKGDRESRDFGGFKEAKRRSTPGLKSNLSWSTIIG